MFVTVSNSGGRFVYSAMACILYVGSQIMKSGLYAESLQKCGGGGGGTNLGYLKRGAASGGSTRLQCLKISLVILRGGGQDWHKGGARLT